MHVTVVLQEGESGYIVASCPALPGCWSQGKTDEEALANIREAIGGWLLAANDETRRKAKGSKKRHAVEIFL